MDQKKLRRVLMTAIVAALASMSSSAPASATTAGMSCRLVESWHGLFCNGGELAEVCMYPDGCTMECAPGIPVPVSC